MDNSDTTSGTERGIKDKVLDNPWNESTSKEIACQPHLYPGRSSSLLSLALRVLTSAARYVRMSSNVIIIHNFFNAKSLWYTLKLNSINTQHCLNKLCNYVYVQMILILYSILASADCYWLIGVDRQTCGCILLAFYKMTFHL